MSWEHVFAQKLKSSGRSTWGGWFTGRVASPVKKIDPVTGEEILVGPLIVKCFGDSVVLNAKHLVVCNGADASQGKTVAIVGNPFTSAAGSQKLLIVGDVPDDF